MKMAAGRTSPKRSTSLTAMMLAVIRQVTKTATTTRNQCEYFVSLDSRLGGFIETSFRGSDFPLLFEVFHDLRDFLSVRADHLRHIRRSNGLARLFHGLQDFLFHFFLTPRKFSGYYHTKNNSTKAIFSLFNALYFDCLDTRQGSEYHVDQLKQAPLFNGDLNERRFQLSRSGNAQREDRSLLQAVANKGAIPLWLGSSLRLHTGQRYRRPGHILAGFKMEFRR